MRSKHTLHTTSPPGASSTHPADAAELGPLLPAPPGGDALSVANARHKLLARGNHKQLLGRAVVPLCALRRGYRAIALSSPHGSPLDSCAIFCHVECVSGHLVAVMHYVAP